MSKFNAQTAEQMRRNTLEMAAALVEDLQYIRSVLERPEQTPDELRRLSGTLRRILIDRSIARIASPRMGRLMFATPDNNPAYDHLDAGNCDVFVSLGTVAFGVCVRGFLHAHPTLEQRMHLDPERVVPTRLDGFLAQKVIFHRGHWVSRANVIKYIAYIKHGIHSGEPAADDLVDVEALNVARRSFRMKLLDNGNLAIDVTAIASNDFDPHKFIYDPKGVDCVLLELLSAANWLVVSPNVMELENMVREELA